ncbi:MAG: ribonuclease III [Alphaproteobacteria bacterium]|nr:ribonuclease III [Alphaproteobacteria bacterium]
MPDTDAIEELFGALGHRFKDRGLLVRALSHSSVANANSYERLEFLGDRVLGLVVAQLLLERFPAENEGEIGRRFAALVQASTLAQVGSKLGVERYARVSSGVLNENIVADMVEALIAALYLDGGIVCAEAFVRRVWDPLVETRSRPPRDPKTALQEWGQAQGQGLPIYTDIGRSGPDHEPEFTVQVTVQDQEPARAVGSSKRAAEQDAAAVMLARLGVKQDA